ncbi:MAG TPA: biotin--protein ligase [Thioalkalivibrio sp.]|nr:biotin--protein ligase [Thioalkalivibrio sp.]
MTTLPTLWHWLDLGDLSPVDLHAAYTGLARAMGPEDPPVLLWARADRPHLSIGASQSWSADLDLAHCDVSGIPVIQRPLGGGTVWLDGDQECFFFIVHQSRVPGGHRGLFDLCLDLVADWFQAMGLDARRVGGQDLWAGGRKIMGSGAATQAGALVFGASVLRHFPAGAFARCIHAPSPGFRDWLADALAEGMIDWRSLGLDPDTASLQEGLRETCARGQGWTLAPWELDARNRAALAETREELSEPLDAGGGRRHVPHGIRINGLRYLLEQAEGGDWLRLVLDDGIIQRVASGDARTHELLQACVGEPAHAGRINTLLAGRLPKRRTERLSARIEALYESIPK